MGVEMEACYFLSEMLKKNVNLLYIGKMTEINNMLTHLLCLNLTVKVL